MLEQPVEFGMEVGIVLGRVVGLFQFEQQRHQRFGDIAPAEGAEMAARIRPAAIGIGRQAVMPRPFRFADMRVARGLDESRDLLRAFAARRIFDARRRIDACARPKRQWRARHCPASARPPAARAA